MDGLAKPSRSEGARPYEDWGVPISRAIRSRAYLVFTYSILANGFATTALIVLQIPFFESLGVSKTLAGTSVAVFTLTSIVGRLGAGVLADRFSKRYVLAASVGMVGAGMPLLALTHSFWPAMAVMILIAPGFGGAIQCGRRCSGLLLTRYFGTLNRITADRHSGFGSRSSWVAGGPTAVRRAGSFAAARPRAACGAARARRARSARPPVHVRRTSMRRGRGGEASRPRLVVAA
jgi:MFS family permease